VTKSSGTATDIVFSRHDFLPFGEEIARGLNGYGPSPLSVKFTGKERDAETGLDYFGARYMSTAQGRFTSPDPPMFDQHVEDPQSWNLYSYSRNNPLRFVDPTGSTCQTSGALTYDDLDGNDCGTIDSVQSFTFNDKGQAFTVDSGVTFEVFENGRRAPVSELSLRDPLPTLVASYASLASDAQLGMVVLRGLRNPAELFRLVNILRQAAKGKGNFGLGKATAAEAEVLGKEWVGEGAKVASDGKTLVSADGLRQYRPPSQKPNLDKIQANFESRWKPAGEWQTNGHLDIIN